MRAKGERAPQAVIQWLGMPGYTDEDYALGEGLRSRPDLYRLSAKGDVGYHLWYDASDKLSSIDFEQCYPDRMQKYSNAPTVPIEVLNSTILKKAAAQINRSISIANLEKMLGKAGQGSASEGMGGGRSFVHYEEVWKIAGTAHRFLLVYNHYPGTLPIRAPAPGSLAVTLFDVLDVAPGCLAN